MSTRTCPECEAVCTGDPFVCIGERCGQDPCMACMTQERLAEHRSTTQKVYFQFLADGEEGVARVLEILDDDKDLPTAYPHAGMVWQCLDRDHKFYMKMDPKIATEIGMQLLLAAGHCLGTSSLNKHKENAHDPQVQDPQPGSGSPEQGSPPPATGH